MPTNGENLKNEYALHLIMLKMANCSSSDGQKIRASFKETWRAGISGGRIIQNAGNSIHLSIFTGVKFLNASEMINRIAA